MGKTVAVIGSGLAGAVTAIALKRQGFEPTLYDKVDPIQYLKDTLKSGEPTGIQFGEVGGGVSLLGNGIKALGHLGLLDAIKQFRIDPMNEMNYLLIDGRDRISKKTQKKGEVESIQILRSKLHASLMKAANTAGVKVFGGKKLKTLTQTENDVTVEFEDGTKVTADFVVGADGIHSATRRSVFPEAAKPEVWATGFVGVVGLGRPLPDGKLLDFEYNGAVYSDPLNSRLVFACRCSQTDGEIMVCNLDPRKPLTDADEWRPYSDLPKEAAKLAELVESWGASPTIVECIRRCVRITPANLYDLPNIPKFSKGRVVLVGDAAHGTTPFYGQGLNQALEDAGVLADLMGHFNEDYAKAFEVYNKIRVPRAHASVALSRKTARRMKASSPIDLKIGRFMMKIVFRILDYLGVDDNFYYHDFRRDVKKAVPGIQLK
ncbi:FAD/NAD(P)-binding domain-containing protein [Rhizoclosmatium globosum]|uniref:FAD/NAD(P)-binding domain-containing protein n=1 Tax=Rhizoclosmatium globosum TaxID=329046 RepID=A0A1Y2CVF8_9FUNG|nr:FAD/NAD(P)-binding domain-containing protein [Rhizoclosmatium globosum]|eukprot:ORY51049.1 FAD/NAD(P)-binding domain-containing protein [Rhizoclosmatium globosum]